MADMTGSHRLEIVAHRGARGPGVPENTLAAFRRAAALGADATELDVRLTSDGVPVVLHRAYLDRVTTGTGPLFATTLAELREIRYADPGAAPGDGRIPTLAETLDAVGGSMGQNIGLEIELKGPEPESADAVARLLGDWRSRWGAMEVTSYEPALLLAMRRACPGLEVDLLPPAPPPWMGHDVLVHQALHLGRLADAQAVHLPGSQLSEEAIRLIGDAGMHVHAWGVDDAPAVARVHALGIRKLCTNDVPTAVAARAALRAR